MTKKDIIETLNNYNLDKDKFIIITGAALVLQNFSFDFCPNNYVYINGYKVASLRDCYNVKKLLNRDKDKKLLLKLEKELNRCL